MVLKIEREKEKKTSIAKKHTFNFLNSTFNNQVKILQIKTNFLHSNRLKNRYTLNAII